MFYIGYLLMVLLYYQVDYFSVGENGNAITVFAKKNYILTQQIFLVYFVALAGW